MSEIGGIGLLMVVLCMPKADHTTTQKKLVVQKARLPTPVYLLCLNLLFAMVLVYQNNVVVSSLVIQGGFGDASAAAGVMTMLMIGGIFAGLVFGFVYKKMHQYILPAAFFVAALGQLILVIAPSFLVLSIGSFISGFGMVILLPSTMALINKKSNPESIPLTSGVMMAAMNLGGFLVTPYIVILSKINVITPSGIVLASAILLVLLAIIVLILTLVYYKG